MLSISSPSATAATPPPEPIVDEVEIVEETTIEYEPHPIFHSCIITARWLGVPLPKGDAKDLPMNAQLTDTGVSVVKLKYGKVYHVAVIQKLTPEGLYIAEGNKIPNEYSERVIDYDDPAILGFWKPQ